MIPLRPSLNDPCQPPRNKLHATGPRRTSPTTLTPIPSSRIRRSAPKYQNKSRKHPKPRTGLFRYWGLSGQDGFLTDSDESPPEWVAAPVVSSLPDSPGLKRRARVHCWSDRATLPGATLDALPNVPFHLGESVGSSRRARRWRGSKSPAIGARPSSPHFFWREPRGSSSYFGERASRSAHHPVALLASALDFSPRQGQV